MVFSILIDFLSTVEGIEKCDIFFAQSIHKHIVVAENSWMEFKLWTVSFKKNKAIEFELGQLFSIWWNILRQKCWNDIII